MRVPVSVALLIVMVSLGLWPTATSAAPTCFGKPATHVMKVGDPTYYGTPGDDVVIGSGARDRINLGLSDGTDYICGEGGNDLLDIGYGGSASGGVGDDFLQGWNGSTLLGGPGNDRLYPNGPGARAEGGTGNDYLGIGEGAIGDGGSGNDTFESYYAAQVIGGSGRDRVYNVYGDANIDCGSGRDFIWQNGATNVTNCEIPFNPLV